MQRIVQCSNCEVDIETNQNLDGDWEYYCESEKCKEAWLIKVAMSIINPNKQ